MGGNDVELAYLSILNELSAGGQENVHAGAELTTVCHVGGSASKTQLSSPASSWGC